MLGPALMVLLNELHNRKDRQTSYEKQLYAELLWLAAAAAAGTGAGVAAGAVIVEGGALEVGAGTFGPAISNMANVRRSGLGGQADKGFTGNVIGPQDRQESPRLQINCGNPDCPNKEFR
jgi:hypothetical protein